VPYWGTDGYSIGKWLDTDGDGKYDVPRGNSRARQQAWS
jgi:hypothetical protein